MLWNTLKGNKNNCYQFEKITCDLWHQKNGLFFKTSPDLAGRSPAESAQTKGRVFVYPSTPPKIFLESTPHSGHISCITTLAMNSFLLCLNGGCAGVSACLFKHSDFSGGVCSVSKFWIEVSSESLPRAQAIVASKGLRRDQTSLPPTKTRKKRVSPQVGRMCGSWKVFQYTMVPFIIVTVFQIRA